MIKRLLAVSQLLIFVSCSCNPEQEQSPMNPGISFTISEHLAEGKNITDMETTDADDYCFSADNEIVVVINSVKRQQGICLVQQFGTPTRRAGRVL